MPDKRWYHSTLDAWSIVIDTAGIDSIFDGDTTIILNNGNVNGDVTQTQLREAQLFTGPVPQLAGARQPTSSVIRPRSLPDYTCNPQIYSADIEKLYGSLVPNTTIIARSLQDILRYQY